MYLLLLMLKFCCVLAYAGGAAAALTAESSAVRRRVVHGLASPALLGIWIFGYLLTLVLEVPAWELWIVAGFLFSLLAQAALEHLAARGPGGPAAVVRVTLPLLAAVAFMVYRPTWSAWS